MTLEQAESIIKRYKNIEVESWSLEPKCPICAKRMERLPHLHPIRGIFTCPRCPEEHYNIEEMRLEYVESHRASLQNLYEKAVKFIEKTEKFSQHPYDF